MMTDEQKDRIVAAAEAFTRECATRYSFGEENFDLYHDHTRAILEACLPVYMQAKREEEERLARDFGTIKD